MIPNRTTQGKYAKSFFYHEYNDIDFFIEDTDDTTIKIYLELIQKSLESESFQLSQIFPLGGRDAVIDKSKEVNQDIRRKQIFIIDGDLYLMYKEEHHKNDNLILLDRYCIENYIIDKNAIEEIIIEEYDIAVDRKECINNFAFEPWYSEVNELLLSLFVEYAIEKKNGLGIPTVSYKVTKLMSSDVGTLCLDKVTTRKHEIRNSVREKITEANYSSDKSLIKAAISHEESIKYISAKDYILPLLFLKIRSFTSTKTTNNKLKFRLAKYCNINAFKTLIKEKVT